MPLMTGCVLSPSCFLFVETHPSLPLHQPEDCGGAAGKLRGEKQTMAAAPFRADLLQLSPHQAGAAGGSRAAHSGLGPQHVW